MVVPVSSQGSRGVHRHRSNATPPISDSGVSLPKVQLLQAAMVLLGSFFVAELTAALSSHSLSLLADAGHVLSDVAALGIALGATWWSSRHRGKAGTQTVHPDLALTPDSCYPRGGSNPHWVETLAAAVNGMSLVAIALWVACEAIGRLQSPTPEIAGLPMLLTAIVGLSVNCINAFFLHQSCHDDLNLKSAFLHVLADIFSSVGVIAAAVAVAWLHWNWADGLISLLVSSSIILLTLPLLIQSLNLLRGSVPSNAIPQPACNCDQRQLEKLLFPSLQELIK